MPKKPAPFSRRTHHARAAKKIMIREDAPETLRFTVLETPRNLGWLPTALRAVICRVLRVRPNANNWSDPNVWSEIQNLVYRCEWFKVYDIIEALYEEFDSYERGYEFEEEINAFFVEEGIGWQLSNGQIVTRGQEAFETVVNEAEKALESSKRPTAASHIHEALQDLSRRPKPDLPGAIYHAMGALECVARDLTCDKRTLGEVLKHHPDLLPKPLGTAISQVWGYASNVARHVEEGREPNREEAELVVGLAAVVATYLTRNDQS